MKKGVGKKAIGNGQWEEGSGGRGSEEGFGEMLMEIGCMDGFFGENRLGWANGTHATPLRRIGCDSVRGV